MARQPGQNNPPIPADDEAFVRTGSTVQVPVLANDFDPDADPLRISGAAEHRPQPTQGEAEVDGSAIRYTAPENPTSPQTSFQYTADDGRGGQRSATVILTFQDEGDNRPPVAFDDATEPQVAGTALRLPVLINDEDPDHDELKVVDITQDGATISADGQAVELVMPDRPVQFTYVVSDGTDTARAAVIVPLVDPAADQPPIGRLDADIEVGAGASVSVDVLANDEDPEGERLHLLQVIGVRHGSATIDGDEVSFTASEQGYVGDAGFSYVVGDDPDPAVANTTVASAQILVTGGANTAPTFTELSVDLPQGAERQVDLNGAVVDPDPNDDHRFDDPRVIGEGFDADLEDGVLRLTADVDAAPGPAGRVEVVGVRRRGGGGRRRPGPHRRLRPAAAHARSRRGADAAGRGGHDRRAGERRQPVPGPAAARHLRRRALRRGRQRGGRGWPGGVHPRGGLLRPDLLQLHGRRRHRVGRARGLRDRDGDRHRPTRGAARPHLHRRGEPHRAGPVGRTQRQRRPHHRLRDPGRRLRQRHRRAHRPQRVHPGRRRPHQRRQLHVPGRRRSTRP